MKIPFSSGSYALRISCASSPANSATRANSAAAAQATQSSGDGSDPRNEPGRARSLPTRAEAGSPDKVLLDNWVRAEERFRPRMPLTRILTFGYDRELLETRCMILRGVGYVAEATTSVDEAIERFQAADFDLVLIGLSTLKADRDRLTRLIRISRPYVRVVYVSLQESEAQDPMADAILDSTPEKLLGGIRDVLLKAAKNDHGGKMPVASETVTGFRMQRRSKPAAG